MPLSRHFLQPEKPFVCLRASGMHPGTSPPRPSLSAPSRAQRCSPSHPWYLLLLLSVWLPHHLLWIPSFTNSSIQLVVDPSFTDSSIHSFFVSFSYLCAAHIAPKSLGLESASPLCAPVGTVFILPAYYTVLSSICLLSLVDSGFFKDKLGHLCLCENLCVHIYM